MAKTCVSRQPVGVGSSAWRRPRGLLSEQVPRDPPPAPMDKRSMRRIHLRDLRVVFAGLRLIRQVVVSVSLGIHRKRRGRWQRRGLPCPRPARVGSARYTQMKPSRSSHGT